MEQEQFRRRHLPHWDLPGATYFITVCLEGSIPTRGLLDLARYEDQLRCRRGPPGMTKEAWEVRAWKLRFARRERWLDHEPANRALEQRELAQEVIQSMFHFAGLRYDLFAYVVMPSHFHWLFYPPRPEWLATIDAGRRTPRERIMYSLKRFTGNVCNRLRGTCGPFWQPESFDHWVRDSDEMERILHYIEQNPVKAGLVSAPEDWEFSSAWFRQRARSEWGVALTNEMCS